MNEEVKKKKKKRNNKVRIKKKKNDTCCSLFFIHFEINYIFVRLKWHIEYIYLKNDT